MAKENPSFLDRVQSASHNYLNEGQRTTITAQREFSEIGVVSAFQELISKNIIPTEKFSDKPTTLTYLGLINFNERLNKAESSDKQCRPQSTPA